MSLILRDDLLPITPFSDTYAGDGLKLTGHFHFHGTGIATHMTSRRPSPGWQSFYSHLGGMTYYIRGASPRTVTKVDVRDTTLTRLVVDYERRILNAVSKAYPNRDLDPSVELFLKYNPATNNCGYYFIDHKEQDIFWLPRHDRLSYRILGLSPFCSQQQLDLTLELNYWKHIELFGEHLVDLPEALEKFFFLYFRRREYLEAVLSSGLHMPPASVISQLCLLRIQPHATVFPCLAKLWSPVLSDELARLKNEDDAGRPAPSYRPLFRALSFIMFGCPTHTRRQLEAHIVDDEVLRNLWITSIADHVAKWQVLAQCILGLMNLPSAMTVPGSTPIPLLTRISLVFGLVGLLLTVLYENCFDHMAHNRNRACNFLRNLHHNEKMATLAVVLSIPRGLFIWSVLLFNAQAFALFCCAIPLYVVMPFYSAVIPCFFWGIWWIHMPKNGYTDFPRIPKCIKDALYRYVFRCAHTPSVLGA